MKENKNIRIPWKQYFLSQALVLSMRSTCRRLMVGAVIVRDGRVIAGGYNGSVSGEVHCIDEGCLMEKGHCIRTVHSEMNAIIQCAKFGVATEGADIYVTHYPCLRCSKAIIQAGIKNIYYLYDYRKHDYAQKLLDQKGIKVEKVDLPDYFFADLETIHTTNLDKERGNLNA